MDNPKSVLEALLFVSPEALPVKEIRKIASDLKEKEIEELLAELIREYDARESGIQIVQAGGGYRMLTRLECSPWLKRLKTVTVSNKLSQPSMETLSIIAYKQPVIRAEIDHIRGVNSDGVIKTLLDRKLIKILGRKEMPGRPLLYGTTSEFLQYFGLKDITELPTLRDIEDFEGEGAAQLTMDDVKALDLEIPEEEREVLEPETLETPDPDGPAPESSADEALEPVESVDPAADVDEPDTQGSPEHEETVDEDTPNPADDLLRSSEPIRPVD